MSNFYNYCRLHKGKILHHLIFPIRNAVTWMG